jgi:putative transposase
MSRKSSFPQPAWFVSKALTPDNHRLHESLNNLTPADVYFGRGQQILEERVRIKKLTIQSRRLQHQLKAA